jgi:biopolymer transport protein ExbD
MNFRSNKSRRTPTEVNLTPLIDIVFQLLIFFVITTTFAENPGIEVDLPKASTDKRQNKDELIIITVTPEGRIIYKGNATGEAELKENLTIEKEERKEAVVLIQADVGTPHGKVVGVMDIIREIGFSKLAIATSEAD